ncbi:MAG: hypothetical protein ACJA2D_001641 [Pseudohongiellaceae bacterium]|jgi:hypothetical protein
MSHQGKPTKIRIHSDQRIDVMAHHLRKDVTPTPLHLQQVAI